MSIFGTGTDAIPIPKFVYALRIWQANQFIDFQEAASGAEMTAEIDAGYYLPDDLAVAVASAFNIATSGASGASALYDCTYDRTDDKFTISRTASGASSYADNAFNLLFDSGTNAASGAGTGMGYAVAADATGASAYEADNELPNRLIPSQPIRNPRPNFKGVNRESVTESGIHTANHVRTDIMFEFQIKYIPEDELLNEWSLFMGKPGDISSPWMQKLDFEFYPKATSPSNYIVFHPDQEDWKPEEMNKLPTFYEWIMKMREVIPKAGTLSLMEIYDGTPEN